MGSSVRNARLWWQKWRWYERNSLPWNRLRIHRHMMRSRAFIRFPVQGNVLEALDDGRLQIGPHTLLEPGCWITIGDGAHVKIGEGCFLNLGTMLAAIDRIEIGDRCVIGSNSVVTRDLPPGVVAAGAPARILREIEFRGRDEEGVRP
jgi:hypothetical protein